MLNKEQRRRDRWIIFLATIMVAVLAWGIQYLQRDIHISKEAGQQNTRILQLVEQCVVDGHCGPQSERDDSAKLVQGVLRRLDCLAGNPTVDVYAACVKK